MRFGWTLARQKAGQLKICRNKALKNDRKMCVVLQHSLGKGDANRSPVASLSVLAHPGIEPFCTSETFRRFITRNRLAGASPVRGAFELPPTPP